MNKIGGDQDTNRKEERMASRYFLVLIAVVLVPFVTARQNPSDKAVISQIDLPLKDELHGILPKPPLPPVKPPHCLNLPVTAQGTDKYEPLHLDHLPLCPPPPAPTPSPTPGPVPTPTPTPTPTPGPTPTPTPTPGPAPTPTPTPGPGPAQAPTPTTGPTLAPTPASAPSLSSYH